MAMASGMSKNAFKPYLLANDNYQNIGLGIFIASIALFITFN